MSGIYWLASYPKSGNTWLRVLLTNYLRDEEKPADINELDINAAAFLRNVFDEWVGIDSAELTHRQIDHYRPFMYEQMAAESSEPLFLKVHDAYQFNADQNPIFSKKATAGVIYLIRNPLDVAVSFAHHRDRSIKNTIRFMGRDETVLEGTDKDGGQLPQKLKSWSSHVQSWANEPHLNLLVIRYEDLIENTAAVFTKIVEFAGLEISLERVRKSVRFSGFNRLQSQEATNGFKEKQATSVSFFRSGTYGTWRQLLNSDEIEQIISDHQTIMSRFGYLDDRKRIMF